VRAGRADKRAAKHSLGSPTPCTPQRPGTPGRGQCYSFYFIFPFSGQGCYNFDLQYFPFVFSFGCYFSVLPSSRCSVALSWSDLLRFLFMLALVLAI
jgi:hypothetical protein